MNFENNKEAIEDSILVTETLLEISEENKKLQLEAQEKLGNVLSELKTELYNEEIMRQSGKAYEELLNLDKQIELFKKTLETLRTLNNNLF